MKKKTIFRAHPYSGVDEYASMICYLDFDLLHNAVGVREPKLPFNRRREGGGKSRDEIQWISWAPRGLHGIVNPGRYHVWIICYFIMSEKLLPIPPLDWIGGRDGI